MVFKLFILISSKDTKEDQIMKLLITLKYNEETKNFKNDIDVDELKENLDFVYVANNDITIRDRKIFISFIGGNLWVENGDSLYLRIPLNLIHDFIVKESK